VANAIACGLPLLIPGRLRSPASLVSPQGGQICLARQPRVFIGVVHLLGLVPALAADYYAHLASVLSSALPPASGKPTADTQVLRSVDVAAQRNHRQNHPRPAGRRGIAHPFTCGDGRGRGKPPL